MNIQRLRLDNFRCFTNFEIDIQSNCVLIEGNNGSGKTSLLEALYYACYLRSFRTRSGRELVRFGCQHFFITVDLESEKGGCDSIQVGFENNSKVVKLNKKAVSSYKDLIAHYRIVSLSENDLALVQGSPEVRRLFLDQSLFLSDADFNKTLRSYKSIVLNRNSLLAGGRCTKQLEVWSQQLWEKSVAIQHKRTAYLGILEKKINELVSTYFSDIGNDISVTLEYRSKNIKASEDFKTFWGAYKTNHFPDELRFRRSLFGAHLDDFIISFKDRKVRQFASRGQQKAVTFLTKIAQFALLKEQGQAACLLLDDFLTDFDRSMVKRCLEVLADLQCQFFITSPLKSFLSKKNLPLKPQIIRL